MKKRSIPLDGVKLARWHRHILYAVTGMLTMTGFSWLMFHYFGRRAGEFGVVIHPLELWSLKVHGLTAMLMLFFVGSLLNGHMRRSWQAKRNHNSGFTLALGLLLLALSGYALYYIADEQSRPIVSAAHWIVGLFTPAALIAHVMLGRRKHLKRTTPALSVKHGEGLQLETVVHSQHYPRHRNNQ